MKRKISIVISILASTLLYSQKESIQRLSIKSPEVSAFEKVGEIPVGNYTGVPNISIPLYKIQSGDLELPISLDYNASAIKVDQEATWVGLNWNLNAGGVVSTQTTASHQGVTTDEWTKLFTNMSLVDMKTGDQDLSQYYRVSGSHELNWPGQYGHNIFTCTYHTEDLTRETYMKILGYNEGEAQLNFANFMGHSFKFIYHPYLNKFIVVGKDQKYEISGGAGFVNYITDSKGIKYYFSEIETIIPSQPDGSYIYPSRSTSYYLTEIVSPTGKRISLQYKNYGNINPIRTITENVFKGHPAKVDNLVERNLSAGLFVKNSYLYQIVSDDEIIRFNVGNRIDLKGDGRKLENIEVYNKANNKLLKRFVFSYDYFQGNTVGGEAIYDYYKWAALFFNDPSQLQLVPFNADQLYKRLKLKSIKEEVENVDGNKVSLPPYEFSYDENSLPAKTSAARDYWGNYNGRENAGGRYYHTFLVAPSRPGESAINKFPYVLDGSYYYADNRFNPSTVGNWLLSNIKYPTGGYTNLYYEPHQFSNYTYYDVSTSSSPAFTTLSTKSSNIDSTHTIPADQYGARNFTQTKEMQIEFSMSIHKPTTRYWKSMIYSQVQLFKTEYYVDPQGGRHPYPSMFKNWVFSDTTDVIGKDDKTWTEKLMLPPGDYKLQTYLTMPQIQMSTNFPGANFISVSAAKTAYQICNGFGVRIKEIDNVDGSNRVVKEYKYSEADGTTSGVLMNSLMYSRNKLLVYQNDIFYNQISRPDPPTLLHYWIQSSQNMIPTGENKIGYNRVEEIERGYKGTTAYINGKKTSIYWNKPNYIIDYYKPQEDPRNGNLLEQYVYDYSGVLQKEIKNTYSLLNTEAHFVNAVVEDVYAGNETDCTQGRNIFENACNSGRAMIYIYPSTKYWIELTKTNEKLYTTNGVVSDSTLYTYNPVNLAVSSVQKTIGHTAESKMQYYIYPQDYSVTNHEYPSALIDKHILNSPIEVLEGRKNKNGLFITSGEINQYNNNGQIIANQRLDIKDRLSLANFRFSNKSNSGVLGISPEATTIYSPFSNYLTKVTCDYNANGDPVYINKKNSNRVVYLWGYNSQYPIAKIEGITYGDVVNALTIDFINNLATTSVPTPDQFRIIRTGLSSKSSLITTYTYKPLVGILTATAPNGLVTTYEYDIFNRLKYVRNNIGNVISENQYHYINQ